MAGEVREVAVLFTRIHGFEGRAAEARWTPEQAVGFLNAWLTEMDQAILAHDGLLANVMGFSLHAATVCEAYQRSRLERLCRYITRPPIATQRLSVDGQGRVVYRYKQPFHDGSTHVVLEPLDFIARLAALVPRPRLNLTRFHGVFAPNFKHRSRIVPHRSRSVVDSDKPPAPMSWMKRLKRVFAMPQGTLS